MYLYTKRKFFISYLYMSLDANIHFQIIVLCDACKMFPPDIKRCLHLIKNCFFPKFHTNNKKKKRIVLEKYRVINRYF